MAKQGESSGGRAVARQQGVGVGVSGRASASTLTAPGRAEMGRRGNRTSAAAISGFGNRATEKKNFYRLQGGRQSVGS